MGDVRCDNDGLAAPGLSIQMKLARLIKVGGLLVRSRPRRTTVLLALSASDPTIDLAAVNLQLKRGHLLPRDAGPMVSKLTAADKPVFADRWMVRAFFGPHRFSPLCSPKAFTATKSSASGACRCRLSAPAARSVAGLKITRPLACRDRSVGVWFGGPDGWALNARTLSSRCKLNRGAGLPILSDDEVRPHDCCP